MVICFWALAISFCWLFSLFLISLISVSKSSTCDFRVILCRLAFSCWSMASSMIYQGREGHIVINQLPRSGENLSLIHLPQCHQSIKSKIACRSIFFCLLNYELYPILTKHSANLTILYLFSKGDKYPYLHMPGFIILHFFQLLFIIFESSFPLSYIRWEYMSIIA